MAQYCTTADLIARFGPEEIQRATKVYDDIDSANNAKLFEAVCEGNGAVYGYLFACLPQAIADAPPEDLLPALKYHAVNFAREALDALTDEVQRLADKSREYFEQLCEAYHNRNTTPVAIRGSGRINYGVNASPSLNFYGGSLQASAWYASLLPEEQWRFG